MLIWLRKLNRWKLQIIAFVGFVFAAMMVMKRPSVPHQTPPISPPSSLYKKSVAGIGVIEPQSEIIHLGVDIPGIIRHVYVHAGEGVKKGAPLLTLDEREINAQIQVLEASLRVAEVQVQDRTAQFLIVKNIKDQRALAKDEFNRRKFAMLLAEAQVRQIKAQLEQARTVKSRLMIRAPIDGEILSVNAHPGEFAASAAVSSDPLIRMGDTRILHVRVEIDEENAGRIQPDSQAYGCKRGNPLERVPLKFIRFEPYVRAKQNLAVAGQRIDTRVLQVVYALPSSSSSASHFVGEQMDVFIESADRK